MKDVWISLFSGIIGVLLTIGYQYFFSQPQSFTFVYDGQKVVVTESEYTKLVEENNVLYTKLLDAQNKLGQLQEQYDTSDGQADDKFIEMQYNIPLTDLEYFSKEGRIFTNHTLDIEDNYNTVYPYCINPHDSDNDGVFIEYYINGKYTNLSGTLYVTKGARSIESEDYIWDLATFSIYGDDKPLYTYTGFTKRDEPILVNVDITGVKFLKIYFKDASYFDSGIGHALIGFGNPIVK